MIFQKITKNVFIGLIRKNIGTDKKALIKGKTIQEVTKNAFNEL